MNDVKILVESIENDVVFLADNGVMDYSLFIANIYLNPKEIETDIPIKMFTLLLLLFIMKIITNLDG